MKNHIFIFVVTFLLAHDTTIAHVSKTKTSITHTKNIKRDYSALSDAEIAKLIEKKDTLTQKQKDELIHDQESIIERTETKIGQIISTQLQEERERREKEIREREDSRPAREAAHTAIEHVSLLEKKGKSHKQVKNGIVGLGVVVFLSLVILLIFFSLPQWIIVMLLAVIASIFATFYFWKSTISEDKIAADKRQIALYQTKSDEYAALSEEERCALLVQRIL